MQKSDINVLEFSEMMCYLEPYPELTKKLDKWGSNYPSEKAHMCDWFASQTTTGSGSYTREEPNSSAKMAYNRLLCPGAMLWIAEAFGEDQERLKEAVRSAKKAEKVYWRGRGNGFRSVIPFERILELYSSPEKWLYDKKIEPFLGYDGEGYPLPVKHVKIRKVLVREGIY